MVALRQLAKGRRDMFNVSLKNVKTGENVRKDFEDVPMLALEIMASKWIRPLEVRMEGDIAVISDGERRFRAVTYANEHMGGKFTTIPVYGEDKKFTKEERVLNQILRNSSKALSPIELSDAFDKLIQAKWTYKQIAEKIGKPVKYVQDLAMLKDADPQVRAAMETKKIGKTAAVRTTKEKNPDKKRAVTDKLARGEKVQVKDVAGMKLVNVRHVKKLIVECGKLIAWKDADYWTAVVFGLRLALGEVKIAEYVPRSGKDAE